MSKTWRKTRRKNEDETFKKPQIASKRPKQALRALIINEQEEVNGNR